MIWFGSQSAHLPISERASLCVCAVVCLPRTWSPDFVRLPLPCKALVCISERAAMPCRVSLVPGRECLTLRGRAPFARLNIVTSVACKPK